MLKSILSLLFSISALSASANFTDLEKVEIKAAESKLIYVGKKITGEHTGQVKIKSGHLNFKGDVLVAGEFEVDMTSINNTDIDDKDMLGKFISHITSPDFFDTQKFATSNLKITSAKKDKGDSYNITADLTIKGQTAPVTFTATVTKNAASANIVFDRTKYGIKYKSGKFDPGLGDKLIYDDVNLTVTLALDPKNKPMPKKAH